ncbi:MAG TPA: MmgE/PrpD family protein [Steroidobacteraceae bacterium]
MNSLSEEIARWVISLQPSHVPAEVGELSKLRMLDTIGLILAARETDAAKAALDVVQQQGGRAESVLIGGTDRVPAAAAAFAHGVIAHCRDFDDTFLDSVVHPGSVVVPVALAVGQAAVCSGAQIKLAIAVGYEISGRIGSAFGRKLYRGGFHPSGIVGPLAAAATAGKLYGLTSPQMVSAMGLAGSMSAGLMEFLGDGSWSKWLHLGWAAHGGIVAAQLAARGFKGPRGVLEGPAGLYHSFLRQAHIDFASLTAGLGDAWHGSAAEFKYYPCAHVIQPFVDAALRLKVEHRLTAGAIREVKCEIAEWCIPLVCEPRAPRLRPATDMQAIASLPFILSCALTDGVVTLDSICAANLRRADVLSLADRISHSSAASVGDRFEGQLEIFMTDGGRFCAIVGLAPVDEFAVRTKFRRNASLGFPPPAVDAVQAAIEMDVLDAQALFRLLARS